MTSILRVGRGLAELHDDGTTARFSHPDVPGHGYLVSEERDRWHTAEHRWGTGFVITDPGSGRWRQPAPMSSDTEGVALRYEPVPGVLVLDVSRRGGDVLTETYRWTNVSGEALTVTSIGLTAPIRDVYPSAHEALTSACHAHVWTGGAWSWLLAQPMSGVGPVLGVIVREGALWAYSVESRNHVTSSDIRGHIVLHPTARCGNWSRTASATCWRTTARSSDPSRTGSRSCPTTPRPG
jgi:hypothetical protein